MKKYILQDKAMNESKLQKVYNCKIYPRGSKITTNKTIVSIGNEIMGGTHRTCSFIKEKKSFYFDSFGGAPDKFLLSQLAERLIYHNYKSQNINSMLCGSYCLYFFHLLEILDYYVTILKIYFG